VLVKRSEDIDTFDRVFGGFWLGQAADVWPAVLAVKERVGVELDPGTDTGAPRQQSDAVTAVPCYSAVEVLRRKDFGEYTADDFAEAQQLMSGLRATAATRRSRRRRPARWQRHKAPDIRATVRRALRTGGEPIRRAWYAPSLQVHGGSAPQVKAAAQRRIQNALDAAAKRLLGFAFDDDVTESIALQAVNGILDRGGLSAKQAVGVEVTVQPYEELLDDVAHLTKAQHDAIYHPERAAPAKALSADDDIVDAEVVPDDPVRQPGPPSPGRTRPDWAEDADSAPQHGTGQLVPLEQAASEVAQANRRAGVSQRKQESMSRIQQNEGFGYHAASS
jgi:hypothetical protein